MKKLFTIALVALISTTAYAQRSIDWSVDEVISPTELNSDFSSGTAIPLSIVLKNNGPDMAKIGDTVLYQMLITTTGNQIILGYPAANTTQFAFRILTKDMAKDDTLQIVQNLTSNLYFSQSTNVKYFITSILRNGGSADPITAEVAPNTTNNSTNKQIVWYNPQKWEVSIKDVDYNNVTVSPNPVADVLNLELNIANVAVDSKVEVLDITGKVVLTSTVAKGTNTASINTSTVANGVYFVKVTNGDVVSSTKIVVSK